MSKNFYQYLDEKTLEFYDNSKVLQNVPDISDKYHGAEDYTYSNSDIQSFYSRGNGFVADGHSEFYEIIKIVKDLTDKHLFLRNMVWKVNNNGRKIEFSFTVNKLESDESTDFFLDGVKQYLILNIIRKLGNIYNIDSEFLKDDEGNRVFKLILTRNANIRKQVGLVQSNSLNTEIMNPKDSSISKI